MQKKRKPWKGILENKPEETKKSLEHFNIAIQDRKQDSDRIREWKMSIREKIKQETKKTLTKLTKAYFKNSRKIFITRVALIPKGKPSKKKDGSNSKEEPDKRLIEI